MRQGVERSSVVRAARALGVAGLLACGPEVATVGDVPVTQLVREATREQVAVICADLIDRQQAAIDAGECAADVQVPPLEWCVASLHGQRSCTSTVGEYHRCATEDPCAWPVVVVNPQAAAFEHCGVQNTCYDQRGVLALAANAEAVGESCLPQLVPQNGFDPVETYVESPTEACPSTVCIVQGLSGDPSPDCQAGGTPPCAPAQEVAEKVFCSCRCDSTDPTLDNCACPAGFQCQGLGPANSYCVR